MRYVEEAWIFNWETGKREKRGEPPVYCPLCGKKLEGFVWTTTDGKGFYPSLVCYNGMPRWLARLRKWFAITQPEGAHYQFEFERQETPTPVDKFDRLTGKPKGE